MLNAIQRVDDVSMNLEDHALYGWISSSHHADARRHYDSFIPILKFIVTFPFYNEQYLGYRSDAAGDEPAGTDVLKQVINEHVREDRTHAGLFMRDFRRLELDKVWGVTRASTLLWSLWASPTLDPAFAGQSQRVRSLVSRTDEWPPFRYLHIEQLERDGHLLFSAAASKVAEIKQQRGVSAVYFGMHHLERESGHVGGSEFHDVMLRPEQLAHAQEIIEQKHAISVEMNDIMHSFARASEPLEAPFVLLEREQEERLAHVRSRIAAHVDGEIPAPAWSLKPEGASEQSRIVAAWKRHHADFLNHPFSTLFREARGEDATFALRCASLLLANRIGSLHAFYKYDCKVDEAADHRPGADVVRFIADTFSTEAELFFHDWDVLEMDQHIPWSMADLLEWWFFNPTYGRPEMEALHEFQRETLRINDDPIIKYWAIMSIHFMSRAFFGNSRVLTERAAEADPKRLPLVYFEGTHHLLYGDVASAWVDPGHPTSLAHLPVTEEQESHILKMMDVFAKHGKRQFDNMARALTTDREKFAFLRDQRD